MSRYWLILLIGLAGGAFQAWWVTSTYYAGVISAEHEAQQRIVIEQQEQNRLGLLAYANRIVKSEAEHDKNTRTIRNLSRELDGLRIHIPTCPVPGTAEGGTDSDGGSRAFSDKLDSAFADFQEETGRLIERCDELNISAIRSNAAH